jgi:cold shock CspA family protein
MSITTKGTVKMAGPVFAFLTASDSDGGGDTYCHISVIEQAGISIQKGDSVVYEVTSHPRGPRAISIRSRTKLSQQHTKEFSEMNNLSKVEPHALRLEAAADKMDAGGIGGHPTRGHAAILRDMAGSMRADAARGKMPNEYGGSLYAAADTAPKGRPILTLTEAAAAKKENAPLVQQVCATVARMGLGSIDPSEKIDINKLNRELTKRGVGTDARMSLKAMPPSPAHDRIASKRIGVAGFLFFSRDVMAPKA